VSHRFTLLLHFSKLLTISIWPCIQARCKGVNPLIVSHRFTLLLANILLKCNSSVNLCSTGGFTPLHVACKNGHIDVVNSLLKCNSSVNLCDTDGYTPLHVASMKGLTKHLTVWEL
jgi:ankyrin repeat protein